MLTAVYFYVSKLSILIEAMAIFTQLCQCRASECTAVLFLFLLLLGFGSAFRHTLCTSSLQCEATLSSSFSLNLLGGSKWCGNYSWKVGVWWNLSLRCTPANNQHNIHTMEALCWALKPSGDQEHGQGFHSLFYEAFGLAWLDLAVGNVLWLVHAKITEGWRKFLFSLLCVAMTL